MLAQQKGLHVLAMRMLAFSNRLGQLVPIVLSRMKPEQSVINGRSTTGLTDHTLIEIRVGELAANLLDDLDMFQICRALRETHR